MAATARADVVRAWFHGENYGWELQFFERGDFFCVRGAFPAKRLAIQFAQEERNAFEKG